MSNRSLTPSLNKLQKGEFMINNHEAIKSVILNDKYENKTIVCHFRLYIKIIQQTSATFGFEFIFSLFVWIFFMLLHSMLQSMHCDVCDWFLAVNANGNQPRPLFFHLFHTSHARTEATMRFNCCYRFRCEQGRANIRSALMEKSAIPSKIV